MALRKRFNQSDIYKRLKYDVASIEVAIINRMRRVGEQFITDARNEQTYKDRTGNLRSSIGYFILKGNLVLDWNLFGKAKGIEAAKELLRSLPKSDAIRLVGVAGMDYASAVEARGLNVITMQSMVAIEELDVQLKRLEKKVGRTFTGSVQGVSNTIGL